MPFRVVYPPNQKKALVTAWWVTVGAAASLVGGVLLNIWLSVF